MAGRGIPIKNAVEVMAWTVSSMAIGGGSLTGATSNVSDVVGVGSGD